MNGDVVESEVVYAARVGGGVCVTPLIDTAADCATVRARRPLRVAIVHDWLVTYGGAERVLEQIVACFPDADVFSLVDFLEERAFLRDKTVTTSFIQKLPFARSRYRSYLPLMPLAIEQLDVSAYDLVISSSHAVAKGILTGPDQMHVSYVHSPIRYAWDLQHQYLQQAKLTRGLKSCLARVILHYIRNWDNRTPNSVDHFIANSAFIARRIKKVYQRDARVIFPPVAVDMFSPGVVKADFYLTVSRMVPYKKIDLIVDAFSCMPERRLVVIGDGPEMKKIRAKAGPNVEIMGHQPFATVHDYMQRAQAFIFAAEEDFGIAVVEAQACGTPVIAYGKGGALETVRDPASHARPTGLFFDEQNVRAIVAALDDFERAPQRFMSEYCRANAERFSVAVFRKNFAEYIDAVLPEARLRSAASATVLRARRPRFLVLDQSGALGGAELSLLDVVKHLGEAATVLLFDDGLFRRALAEAGIQVDITQHRLSGSARKQGGVTWRAVTGLIALARETVRHARDVEVIYANTQCAMVVGALAGRLIGKPVVWHVRDIVSEAHFGRIQRFAIKQCARLGVRHVIANSAASAQAFRHLTGDDSTRVQVVFNGISAAPFEALETIPRQVLRERLKLPVNAFLVGSFSRFAPWKGQHVLLQAAVLNPALHIVLVGAPLFGEEEYATRLRAFVAEHQLGERVHFLGFQHDVATCMKAIDVVAHTSIAPEPFGRVVVEGMLAKKPVVAARAGGVVEIVEDCINGLLYEPGDVKQLNVALTRLSGDAVLRARLVANGFETAVRRFGVSTYVESVERILMAAAHRS